MVKQSEFVDYLMELLDGFGASARRMFGGFGIYRDGLMFGLVADDELFLKIDEENEQRFIERELPNFYYERGGQPYPMSYRQAPPEALDDPAEMREWAMLAFEAAVRTNAKKKKRPTGKSKSRKV